MNNKTKFVSMSDADLVDIFKDGNDHAFAVIIDRHGQKMRNAAKKILKDLSLVDDIVQESCIKAFQAIRKDSFTLQNLPGWLSTIARNDAINHYRKVSSRPMDQVSSEKLQSVGFKRAEIDDDTERILVAEERIDEMLTALSRLDDVYQEVLLLHYIEGYTFDQISKIKDTCPVTLRGRSRRALKMVKAECEKK